MHVTQVNNSRGGPHRVGAPPARLINRLRRSRRRGESTREHVRPFRRLTVSAVAAAIALVGFAAAESPAAQAAPKRLVRIDYCDSIYADKPITQQRAETSELSMTCLINKVRVDAGAPPLRLETVYAANGGSVYQTPLWKAATGHATRAVALKWWIPDPVNDPAGKKTHIDPETGSNPTTRIKGAGYCPNGTWAIAENTFTSAGMGQQFPPTPRGVVTWWATDPYHWPTLINPTYREHRIAILPGSADPNATGDPSGTFVENLGSCT